MSALTPPQTPKWVLDPSSNTRCNTPIGKKTRSDVYNVVKRLDDIHEMSSKYTHICIVPGCKSPLMRLARAKNKEGKKMAGNLVLLPPTSFIIISMKIAYKT